MNLVSLRYDFVTWLARHSYLFSLYYACHPRFKNLLVRTFSDLVIEGYPRCANSFSVLAFERAQGRRLHIGHHLHAQAQIELGVRYGLPVLVLIRDPASATASLITRECDITPEQALRQYIYFYECVERYRDDIVLADFRIITSDYAHVIKAVNIRFGTSFKSYVNSMIEDAAVFTEIDALNEENEGGAQNQLARPSEAKSALLGNARARVEREPLLIKARAVFERLVPICV